MNKDKSLLKHAAATIRELRQENKMLQLRLSGFEDCLLLLKTAPSFQGTGMMHPDIAYEIDKRVEEITMEEDSTPKTIRESRS